MSQELKDYARRLLKDRNRNENKVHNPLEARGQPGAKGHEMPKVAPATMGHRQTVPMHPELIAHLAEYMKTKMKGM